ncbi:MAG: hypothetical protein AMJ54_14515 [Deltaproteobacteria bacterium SG8_13]|nr:MAG: hypothetical protein AMJ54_14515 [Deltaproteobacteria bacterium SG8_13]
MRKTLSALLLVIGLLALPPAAAAEVDFVMEINPLSYMISPDVDNFNVTDGILLEEIEGVGSLYPNLKAGVGFESETMIFDILGGVGYLWNDAFTATAFSADLVLRLKVDQRGIFTVGPHLGMIYFDPTYDGTAQVSLGSDTGLVGGVAFTVGSPRVAFTALLDYLSAKFDVSTGGGWTASQSQLDLSGFQVVLGVQFRF